MVPIMGRASASFSSMLELKRIGMNNTGVTGLTGRCKSWTLDSVLDRGLDGGLDFGPKFGPSFGLVITACFV